MSTRETLQRVATHVLARRRHEVTGRFGLRATPGGFGTPAFGPEHEVLRVSGGQLVREAAGAAQATRIDGSTLRELAQAAGADLDRAFECGVDTPELGDPDAPIRLDLAEAALLADWFWSGAIALDAAVAGVADAAATQLWPEHFDLATSLPLAGGVNLGASPGDAGVDEPYLYVGPWTAERPGDPGFWNAPFGAVLRRGDGVTTSAAAAFFRQGLDQLRG